jgi:MYXO-CTERM domain-containing protein
MKRQHRKNLNRPSSKRRRRILASLAAAGVAGSGSLAQADITTTLTGVPGSVNNSSIPAGHGSTAETTLTWSATPEDTNWDQYADWAGRGEVYQINDRVASIMFAPTSPNTRVLINSFELDEWAGGGDTTAAWRVSGSTSGEFASGLWTDKNTANDPNDLGGRTLVTLSTIGNAGETLTLTLDHSASGGFISYLAMDNLTFTSVVIPEPATAVMAWLGVAGLGALAMRRKRS